MARYMLVTQLVVMACDHPSSSSVVSTAHIISIICCLKFSDKNHFFVGANIFVDLKFIKLIFFSSAPAKKNHHPKRAPKKAGKPDKANAKPVKVSKPVKKAAKIAKPAKKAPTKAKKAAPKIGGAKKAIKKTGRK